MPGVPTGRACDACRKQKKKVRAIKSWYTAFFNKMLSAMKNNLHVDDVFV